MLKELVVVVQQRILQDTNDDDGAYMTTDPLVWTLVWVGALFVLLICPFVLSKRRRKLCYRRFVERDWSSNDEDAGGATFLPHSRIVRSYPIGDPRHKFTQEEAEDEMKRFILDKLDPYSKVLDKFDFDVKKSAYLDDDIESQTAHSSSSTVNEPTNVDASNHSSSVDASKNPCTYYFPTSSRCATEEESNPYFRDEMEDTVNADIKLPSPGITLQDYVNSQKLTPLDENLDDTEELNTKEKKKKKKRKVKKTSDTKNTGKSIVSMNRNNECSICLGALSEGETVSWSALDCEHVFHQECIVNWLMTLGRKSIDNSQESIMQLRLCRYDMKCPNCRQDFIPNATS